MSERESVIRRQIELTELMGCPGHEQDVARYLLEAVKPLCDEAWIDPMGSVLAFRKARSAGPSLRILLDAHTDEVGFMVSHVEDTGFLRLAALGGIDRRVLMGTTVELVADDGRRVTGIIGSLPPHVTTPADREKLPELADMFLDIGAADAQEVAARGIHVGSVGSFATRTRMLDEHHIVGKAFDDRTACNVILHVLERFREQAPPNGILCAFSTQEEVGLRGARVAAYTLKPDIALALENTTATDVPGVPAGTDAGAIAVSRSGVPTGVVSVPCRYIHAPVAMLDIRDLEATVELVTRFCSLPPDDGDTREERSPSV